ncbi:hypothetical protein [Roseomonas sp. KE2513]|nr:hypothetical protein [Roseomonas sp. KE2513]
MEVYEADLADDLAVEEDLKRLPVGTAFWVIGGISILLWVGIVAIVSAFL